MVKLLITFETFSITSEIPVKDFTRIFDSEGSTFFAISFAKSTTSLIKSMSGTLRTFIAVVANDMK